MDIKVDKNPISALTKRPVSLVVSDGEIRVSFDLTRKQSELLIEDLQRELAR
jgi:hypothetical protein